MPGETVLIGPFKGGLNTFSDSTSVADDELVEMVNMELDLDGSVVSRPPFTNQHINFPVGATGNVSILGYFNTPETSYLIASDNVNSTYYFDGSTWTLITNTFAAAGLTQYNDLAWLVSPESTVNAGGSWSPTAGFTAVPAMPHGDFILAHKNRLWIGLGRTASANGTRLFLSNAGAPTVWPGNFLSIGPGDGQNIVFAMQYYDDMLIFKTGSVFRFSYNSDPGLGQTSKLSPTVGLATKECVATSQNQVYWLHQDAVYQMANFQIIQINEKVPLRFSSMNSIYTPYAVSVFNQRIIVSYYDTMYVWSLRTKTWSTWRSDVYGPIGKIIELRSDSPYVEALAHVSLNASAVGMYPSYDLFPTFFPGDTTRIGKVLKITDAALPNIREHMVCSIRTKNYNYQAASNFKRMFWWGADALFGTEIKGTVEPVVFKSVVTWGRLLASATWGSELMYSWGQPLTGGLKVVTDRESIGVGVTRKFAKFFQSLRFRQVFFRIEFATDGSSSTGPVRLFNIVTRVNTKQDVVKALS